MNRTSDLVENRRESSTHPLIRSLCLGRPAARSPPARRSPPLVQMAKLLLELSEVIILILLIKVVLPPPVHLLYGNMQMFGHTKRMAENPIQFVWERPEIDHIALYPVLPVALTTGTALPGTDPVPGIRYGMIDCMYPASLGQKDPPQKENGISFQN